MRNHCTLTESSLSPHSGKGREGNREGNREVGSSSIYLTVPRERLAITAETTRPTTATMDDRCAARIGGQS